MSDSDKDAPPTDSVNDLNLSLALPHQAANNIPLSCLSYPFHRDMLVSNQRLTRDIMGALCSSTVTGVSVSVAC